MTGALWSWAPVVPLGVSIVAYGWAARRTRSHGNPWPWQRATAFACGSACLAAALLPPLAAHDEDFVVHVWQHLLLAMLGPLLLARSAPVTLVLRTVTATSGRRLVSALRWAPVAALTGPVAVLLLDAGGLYALYLTPLYGAAESSPLLHALVHLHLLIAGCLFSWYVVGLDPSAHRRTTLARLAVLLVAGAAHGTLAKLMYARELPTGVTADATRAGAQLMYYGGDLIEVLAAVLVLHAWYVRAGRRAAAVRRA